MIICLPAAFLGVGSSELLLVLAVALILLGPRELPRIARSLGRFASRLHSVSERFRSELMSVEGDVPGQGRDAGGTAQDRDRVAGDTATKDREIAGVGHVPDEQKKDADHELAG